MDDVNLQTLAACPELEDKGKVVLYVGAPERETRKSTSGLEHVLVLYMMMHRLAGGSAWLLGVRFSISLRQVSKTLAESDVGSTQRYNRSTDRR